MSGTAFDFGVSYLLAEPFCAALVVVVSCLVRLIGHRVPLSNIILAAVIYQSPMFQGDW
jgi:hypothetical protein